METPIIVGLLTLAGIIFTAVFAVLIKRKQTNNENTQQDYKTWQELMDSAKDLTLQMNELIIEHKAAVFELERKRRENAELREELKTAYIEYGELSAKYDSMQNTVNEIEKKLRESETRENILHLRVLELEAQMGIASAE